MEQSRRCRPGADRMERTARRARPDGLAEVVGAVVGDVGGVDGRARPRRRTERAGQGPPTTARSTCRAHAPSTTSGPCCATTSPASRSTAPATGRSTSPATPTLCSMLDRARPGQHGVVAGSRSGRRGPRGHRARRRRRHPRPARARHAARQALPFLTIGPAAILMAVSADAVFAATGAWAALSPRRCDHGTRRLGRYGLAVSAGLLFGWCVMESYGLVLLGAVAVAVLLSANGSGRARGQVAVVAGATAGRRGRCLRHSRLRPAEAYPALQERYWACAASQRPGWYWVVGNLAALVLVAGPMLPARSGSRRITPDRAAAAASPPAGGCARRGRPDHGRCGGPVLDEQGRGRADLAPVPAVADAERGVAAGALAPLGGCSPRRWLPWCCSTSSARCGEGARGLSGTQRLRGEAGEPVLRPHLCGESPCRGPAAARRLRGGRRRPEPPRHTAVPGRHPNPGPARCRRPPHGQRRGCGPATRAHVVRLDDPSPAGHRSTPRRFARATSSTCTKSRIWPPSSKTLGRPAGLERGPKDRGHPRVRGVARHPRAVDVVVPQPDDRHADCRAQASA